MKKLLAILVACLMPICLIAGSGDVNGDGKIDVADIVELLNHLNGNPTKNYQATEADANNDGVVDKNDVKAIADIISSGNLSAVSYDIPIEQLNGWDDGVFFMSENSLENFYIVYKTNQEEDQEAVTICLNSANNEDAKRSVIFNFNKEGTLQDIILSGILFKAFSFTEEMFFVAYNNGGEILGSFSVPCDNIDLNTEYSLTRASRPRNRSVFRNSKGKISIPKIKEFAKKATPIVEKSTEAIQTAINLDEGKYGEILLSFVVGGLVGLVDLPGLAAIIAEQGIEALLKYLYDLHRKKFLGNAEIEITSIKRTSKTTITVEGKISGISSIPKTRIEPIESDWGQEVTNVVYWGIAVGKSGQPGLYLNDNCSEKMPITSETFSYTFYFDEIPGQILYFRPFLAPDFHFRKSSDIRESIGKRAVTDIRYGERKEFLDMNVELSHFRQVSSYKENGKNKVQISFDGNIPGIFQGLSGWGFLVKTESGSFQQLFNSKNNINDLYPPLQQSFICDILLEENDLIDNGEEMIANIIIRPYFSLRNSLILFNFLDDLNYEVSINKNSSIVTLSKFTQTNACYSKAAYIYKNKKYDFCFETSLSASIDNTNNVEDWGYVYEDLNGDIEHISLKKYNSSNTDSRFVYYRNEPKSYATLYSYIKYYDIKDYLYGDKTNYPLEYDKYPKSTTLETTFFDETSAKVKCEYKEAAPWGGTCGLEYWEDTHIEKSIKIEFETAQEEVVIPLSGLKPNTVYYYQAFIKYGDADYVLGEVKSFKTNPLPYNSIVLSVSDVTPGSAILHAKVPDRNFWFKLAKKGEDFAIPYEYHNGNPTGEYNEETGEMTMELMGLDIDETYQFYVFYDSFKSDVFEFKTKDIDHDPYVDLGLSTKWASSNIGASDASATGSLFAWGETSPKNTFSKNNYEHYIVFEDDDSSYMWYRDIGVNISGSQYDAARIILGSSWRIPTYTEWRELYTLTCISSNYHGVSGVLFLAENGHNLFISYDLCWTATLSQIKVYNKEYAYVFDSECVDTRYSGHPIRPVHD